MSGLFNISGNGFGSEQYTPYNPDDCDGVDPFDCGEPIQEGEMTLRPYQERAVLSIYEQFNGRQADGEDPGVPKSRSTLLVLATGLGKTVIAGEVIRRRPLGRVLFIAHRTELITQGQSTIEFVTGEEPSIEMAERYARQDANVVIATVQTLNSGMGGDGRKIAFNPADFSMLITDEAHRSVADTYQRVYKHFMDANPKMLHLGLTATPDRADEKAMGRVFESVAMTYELADGVFDGWLVTPIAVPIQIDGLDYSTISTTAGDLNGKQLAEVMEAEGPLHEMVQAIVEVACGVNPHALSPAFHNKDESTFQDQVKSLLAGKRPRKTLVFASSVAHADRLAEILNRWLPGSARWICGKTAKDERSETVKAFRDGEFAFLCNVGCLTEGYDEPSIEIIVMARPTKSRSLYAQMLGRGSRPLRGLVDGLHSVEERKKAIADSKKPALTVLDFVGNAGKHRLITPADSLGGNYDDEVVEQAKKNIEARDGKPADVAAELEKAQAEIAERKARLEAQRAKILVGSKYRVGQIIDPFKLLGVTPYRERGWEQGREITTAMREALVKQKLWDDKMNYSTARQLIQGMADRRKKNLCTVRQASLLVKNGLPPTLSFDQARKAIDAIAKNGWKLPQGYKAG